MVILAILLCHYCILRHLIINHQVVILNLTDLEPQYFLLFTGIAKILSEMGYEKIASGLKDLCSVQVLHLNRLLAEKTDQKIIKGSKTDPTIYVDRLAVIFRYWAVVNSMKHYRWKLCAKSRQILNAGDWVNAMYKVQYKRTLCKRCTIISIVVWRTSGFE